MTVGVSKKRVRVVTQDTNSSIEEEKDLYVVDTTNDSLLLATSTDVSNSVVDLTGDVTIGSDTNSQVSIGSGTSSDVDIGSSGNSSTSKIKSQTIVIGTSSGNHNIYIGETSTASSDSINIGTSPKSDITIGSPTAVTNTLIVDSKNITVGHRSGTSPNAYDSAVTIQGGSATIKTTGDTLVNSVGYIKLVGADASLDQAGTRSYLNIDTNTVSLGNVNSSNSILSRVLLSSSEATVYGGTVIISAADQAAINTVDLSITATDAANITAVDLGLGATSTISANTPEYSITNTLSNVSIGGASKIVYSSEGTTTSSVTGLNTIKRGKLSSIARTATISNGSNSISSNSIAADLTVQSDASNGLNILGRSSSGIRLRAQDLQLNDLLSTNQTGFYLDLESPASSLSRKDSTGTKTAYYTITSGAANTYAEDSVSITSGGACTVVATSTYTHTANSDSTQLLMPASGGTELRSTSLPVYINHGVGNTQSDLTTSIPAGSSRLYAGSNSGHGVALIARAQSNGTVHYAGFTDSGNPFYSNSGFTPFTGIHIFEIEQGQTITTGDAVILVNKKAALTTKPNDSRCVGIAITATETHVEVASLGDTECAALKGFKVCGENGTTISAGDLLTTSSTAGYLMKQSDDIMRSSTVGKSAVDVVFDNNNLAVDVYGFIYCG